MANDWIPAIDPEKARAWLGWYSGVCERVRVFVAHNRENMASLGRLLDLIRRAARRDMVRAAFERKERARTRRTYNPTTPRRRNEPRADFAAPDELAFIGGRARDKLRRLGIDTLDALLDLPRLFYMVALGDQRLQTVEAALQARGLRLAVG